MIKTEMFVLISALVHFIFAVVLGGILIVEYHKRKKKFIGGILGYGLFLIVIIGFFIFDIYRNLVVSFVWMNWICLSLAILANISFLSTSFKYLKYINKKLFFSVPVFAVSIIIIEILRLLYADKSFEIYTAIATLSATLLGYFVIVKFLINTDEK